MNSSVQTSMNFEYMYSPQRARNLYSRHKDLTHNCQKQKIILDWEKQTVITHLDKEQTRFKQRATKIFAQIPELKERVETFSPCGRRRVSSAVENRVRRSSGLPVFKRPASCQDVRQSQEEMVLDQERNALTDASARTHKRLSKVSVEAHRKRFWSIQEKANLYNHSLDTKVKQFIDSIEAYKEECKESLEVRASPSPPVAEEVPEKLTKQRGFNRKMELGSQFRMLSMATMMQKLRVDSQNTENSENTAEEEKSALKHEQSQHEHQTDKATSVTAEKKVEFTKNVAVFVKTENLHPRKKKIPSRRFYCPSTKQNSKKVHLILSPSKQTPQEGFCSNSIMCEAWDAFTKDVNIDNMRRLKAFAAKNKGKVRRPRSTASATMSGAEKAIQAFKDLVTQARRRKAALEKEEVL